MKALLGLAITPLLAYPAVIACLAAVDAWGGERLALYYLRHERRTLWDTFWRDYAAAVPIMYLLVGLVVASYFAAARIRPGAARPGMVIPVCSVAAWGAAVYLSGSWVGPGQLAMAASGAVIGIPLYASLRALTSRNAPGDA